MIGIALINQANINPSTREAIMLSVLGMGIVFGVLLMIIVVIKLISLLSGAINGKEPAAVPAAAPVVSRISEGMIPAAGSSGDIALYDTSDEDAALVMAIVADELKAPLNELRFISIREKR
ncbi:MAG: OadG family protein [Oscillospiraceae bacterium]|jgi:sodium pump decarboxylase gamma subunit|nr:OadG family protein [Oscillospiraceae bacterium]